MTITISHHTREAVRPSGAELKETHAAHTPDRGSISARFGISANKSDTDNHTPAARPALAALGRQVAPYVKAYVQSKTTSDSSTGQEVVNFAQNQIVNQAMLYALEAGAEYLGISTGASAAGVGGATAGAAASSGAAATSTLAGAASALWPVVVAYAVVKGYGAYQANKENFSNGTVTDKEIDAVFHPDLFGEQEWNPLHDEMVSLSLGHWVTHAIFGSTKHEDQLLRDRMRLQLRDVGIIDEEFKLHNADGSAFDMGRDGGDPAYQLDVKNPMAGEFVTMAYPLAFLLSGGDEKLSTDFTGYFINGALTGGGGTSFDDARMNLKAIADKAGITADAALQLITAARDEGKIPPEAYAAYVLGIDTLFNGVRTEDHARQIGERIAGREGVIAAALQENPELSNEKLTALLAQ